MKTPPVSNWIPITSREPVHIPDATGEGIAETIWKDVPAWKDPETGEVFLADEARKILESVKARYLGILAPHQIRALRGALKQTQRGMAEPVSYTHLDVYKRQVQRADSRERRDDSQ